MHQRHKVAYIFIMCVCLKCIEISTSYLTGHLITVAHSIMIITFQLSCICIVLQIRMPLA